MIEINKKELNEIVYEFGDELKIKKVSNYNSIFFKTDSTPDGDISLNVQSLELNDFEAVVFNDLERWVENNLRRPVAKLNNLSEYAKVYDLSESFRDAEQIMVTKEAGDYAAWDVNDWVLLEHKDASSFEDFINQIGYEVE